MGKFKAEYESKANDYPKWKKDFINYSEAKLLIKAIRKEYYYHTKNVEGLLDHSPLFDDHNQPNIDIESHESLKSHQSERTKSIDSIALLYHTFLNQKEDLESLYNLDQGNIIHDLINAIDKEIDNLYYFYITEERKLHKDLTAIITIKDIYEDLSLFQFASEISKLNALLTSTMKLCMFLDLNMKCIQRICYHIDKHLKKIFRRGSISLKYLREKLSNPNSNLNYILQYKIIDEVSAIGEYLHQLIMTQSSQIKPGSNLRERLILDNFTSSSLNNSQASSQRSTKTKRNSININGSGSLECSLLSENDKKMMLEIDSSITTKEQEMTMYQRLQNKIKDCSESIKQSIKQIDEDKHFRVKFKNYCISIKYGYKAIGKNQYFTGIKLEEDDSNVIINCLMDEELIIKQFVPRKSLDEYLHNYDKCVSLINQRNIKVILLLTALLTLLYPIVLFTPVYVTKIYTEIESLKYFFLSSCFLHIGLLLSNFIYGTLLSTSKHYKASMFLSLFLLALGFSLVRIIRTISEPYYKKHEYIFIISQKVIFGLGVSSLITRKYIVTYSSRPLIRNIIKKYSLFNEIGRIIGFLASGIITTLQAVEFQMIDLIFESFYYYNITGLVLIGLVFLYIAINFTNPSNEEFSINVPIVENNANKKEAEEYIKTISIEDTKSILKVNQQLEEDNLKEQYNNLNMIQLTIREVLLIEKGLWSYKHLSFLGIVLISLCNKMLPELGFLLLFTLEERNYILFIFPLFCLYNSSASIISYFIQFKYKVKLIERYWISIFVILNLLLTHALIFIPYNKGIGLYVLGCFIWFILIVFHCLITNQSNRLLKKIIPQEYNLCGFNVSLYLTALDDLSKIIVYCVLFLYMHLEGKTGWKRPVSLKDKLHTYYWFICIIFVEFIFAFGFLTQLRLKAIARIFKKNFY